MRKTRHFPDRKSWGLVLAGILLAAVSVGMAQCKAISTGVNISPEEDHIQRQLEDTAVKKVALTYDDGPSSIYTEALLDVLAKADVKASFFLLGEAVEGREKTVKRIQVEGHVIGNHTYSHVNLCQMQNEAALQEVADANEAIRSCTGEYPQFFRPPFGNCNEELNRQIPMLMVLWDVDTLDWSSQNKDSIINIIVKNVKENDIILMHDGYEATVEATREIIPILQGMGYTFVTVDEVLYP